MDEPPLKECPRGCLLVKEQIKTCRSNVSISESSRAKSYDSWQCSTCRDYISVISTHDFLEKSEEKAVIAQFWTWILNNPCTVFMAVQWFALSPHSEEVQSSFPSRARALSIWSCMGVCLHVSTLRWPCNLSRVYLRLAQGCRIGSCPPRPCIA